jgi:hypothetical protein
MGHLIGGLADGLDIGNIHRDVVQITGIRCKRVTCRFTDMSR